MVKIKHALSGEEREVSRRHWEIKPEYTMFRDLWHVHDEGDPVVLLIRDIKTGKDTEFGKLDRDHAQRMISSKPATYFYREINKDSISLDLKQNKSINKEEFSNVDDVPENPNINIKSNPLIKLFESKKAKALRLIGIKIFELQNIKLNMVKAWQAHSFQVLRIYLGNESEIVKQFEVQMHLTLEESFYNATHRELLISAIDYIKEHGVSKEKTNFIYRLSEQWAIAICTVIAASFVSAGYWWGLTEQKSENKFDLYKSSKLIESLRGEVSKLKNENHLLLKSLKKSKSDSLILNKNK